MALKKREFTLESGSVDTYAILPRVKGKIHMTICQPAVLYGMETETVTNSDMEELEVTDEYVWMGVRTHTRRPCQESPNDNIRKRLAVQYITVQEG